MVFLQCRVALLQPQGVPEDSHESGRVAIRFSVVNCDWFVFKTNPSLINFCYFLFRVLVVNIQPSLDVHSRSVPQPFNRLSSSLRQSI